MEEVGDRWMKAQSREIEDPVRMKQHSNDYWWNVQHLLDVLVIISKQFFQECTCDQQLIGVLSTS